MAGGVSVTWYVGVNIVTSVGIVLLNKAIFGTLPYAVTLTISHALLGVVVLACAWGLKLFRPKWFTRWDLVLCGIATVGSVGLFNLTLQYCSIGFYQLSKLAVTPAILLVESLTTKKRYPRKVLLVVTLLLLGIWMATVTDLEYSAEGLGLALGFTAALATALNSVRVHSLSKIYEAGPHQYNFNNQIGVVIFGPPLAVLLDFNRPDGLLEKTPTTVEVQLVLLSGLCALGVNWSATQLIAAASPLTYQVVGHVKTCLVFLLGRLFSPAVPPATPDQMLRESKHTAGVCIAIAAAILYSNIKSAEGNSNKHDCCRLIPSAALQQWLNGDFGAPSSTAITSAKADNPNYPVSKNNSSGVSVRKKVPLTIRETGKLAKAPGEGLGADAV